MSDIDFSTFQSLLTKDRQSSGDVFVRFYDRVVKSDSVNEKTGMPIFKTRCFVQIRIKNNSSEIYDQPASDEKIQRYPVEYNRYLLNKKQVQEGTPLDQFSFLTVAQIEALKYYGIFSVEALAGLTQQKAQDLDILSEWQKAKNFLDTEQLRVAFEKLKKDYALLEEENRLLKETKSLKKRQKDKSSLQEAKDKTPLDRDDKNLTQD